MATKRVPEAAGPALSELKRHLRDNGIEADEKIVATVLIEIVREKVKKESASELLHWIQQLAIDLVQ